MVTSSNTCVMPPVGRGNAAVIMRIRAAIAKLFSSNTSVRSAKVFVPGDASQVSSSSLKG